MFYLIDGLGFLCPPVNISLFKIYRDLSFCHSHGLEKNIDVDGMSKLIERSRPETIEPAVNGRSETSTLEAPEGSLKIGELFCSLKSVAMD